MNGIEREVARQGKERLWRTLLRVAERTPYGLRRHLFPQRTQAIWREDSI